MGMWMVHSDASFCFRHWPLVTACLKASSSATARFNVCAPNTGRACAVLSPTMAWFNSCACHYRKGSHLSRWMFALIQFFPLSLFAAYAFWHGAPDEQRWREAFEIASLAACVQLAIVLPQPRPANRLVLAANIYVMLGGLAFLTQQWWFLHLYDALRESAIFITMLGVGIASTLFTASGYAAIASVPRQVVIHASLWLLAATALALAVSLLFRGDRTLAAVLPIICLAVVQRILVYQASRSSQVG